VHNQGRLKAFKCFFSSIFLILRKEKKLKKTKMLKKNFEFKKVLSKGAYYSGNNIEAFILKNNKTLNFIGLAISTKTGKAHIRNKIKRRMKNIIITNEKSIQINFNYVIIIKEAILNLDYTSMEKELLELLKKVGK